MEPKRGLVENKVWDILTEDFGHQEFETTRRPKGHHGDSVGSSETETSKRKSPRRIPGSSDIKIAREVQKE